MPRVIHNTEEQAPFNYTSLLMPNQEVNNPIMYNIRQV